MRRNTVLAMAAVVALGLIVWVATRPDRPQPAQISTAEKIVPGKTVEKGARERRQGRGARRRRGSRHGTRRHHHHRHSRHRQPAVRRVGADHLRDRRPRLPRSASLEGGTVNAGDVLVKLDDALAQAEVADAQGPLRSRRGQQRSRQAALAHRQRHGKGHRRGDGQLRDRARGARAAARAALQAHHQGAVPGPGRHAQGVAGRLHCRRHADREPGEDRLPQGRLQAAGAVPALRQRRPDRRRDRRCAAGQARSPARSTPSIRRSTSTGARCSSGRGCRTRTSCCGRACSPASLVKGKQTREVVLAPESAIVPRGGETFVFRIENGKADRGEGQARRAPGRRGRDPGRRDRRTPRSSRPASSSCATVRPSRSSRAPARPAPAGKKGGT